MKTIDKLHAAQSKIDLLTQGLGTDSPGGHLALSGMGLYCLIQLLNSIRDDIQNARYELTKK